MSRFFRKPNLNKSISGMTKGYLTRQIKRSIFPWYGKRGMGMLNPKKYLYNKMYYRSTVGIPSPSKIKQITKHKYRQHKNNVVYSNYKICPKCGNKIPLYYNFCSHCGHNFQ